jgi:glycosyltransferase involved in cell wall biosynthesis
MASMLPSVVGPVGSAAVSRVSIVIRALNEAADLPALYEGLAMQSRQPDEVVLVDSGSTDDTVAISRAAGASIVSIAAEEFSFGRALNVGCSAATGDIFVFVSAHVFPIDEFWLERLVAPLDEHDDIALAYGRQTGDEDRTAFSEMEILRRWFPDRSDPDQDHPFCNNANCAVRASVWKLLPYDEYLTGLEDMDWARRALAEGHRICYVGDAAIAHVHEEIFSQTVNRYRREAIAHKRVFGHQKMGVFEAFGLFVANCGRDYLAAVPRRKLLRNLGSIPRFRAAQFWGTWKGFRQDGDPTTTLKRRFYYPKGFTPKADRYQS